MLPFMFVQHIFMLNTCTSSQLRKQRDLMRKAVLVASKDRAGAEELTNNIVEATSSAYEQLKQAQDQVS